MEMAYDKIVELLSESRFQSYLQRCGDDVNAAIRYYDANVAISQACYHSLHSFQIALRNRMHFTLTRYFDDQEWYNHFLASDEYADFHPIIINTKKLLKKRDKKVHADKMMAELSLGFWVKMYNSNYQKLLWRPLRKVFVNLPKKHRQRSTVSSALNRAKNFRNRIFHFEPICWHFSAAKRNYDNIMKILHWLDADFHTWTDGRCTFNSVMHQERKALEELGVEAL